MISPIIQHVSLADKKIFKEYVTKICMNERDESGDFN